MSDQPIISRVASIILRVSDLKGSTAFYRDTLGLTVQFAFEGFAFFAGGGVTLILNENKAIAASAGAGAGGIPATEVVFDVADVRGAHATLKERGVAFTKEPRIVTTDATHDTLATDFRDPDGHVLSIMGRVAKG